MSFMSTTSTSRPTCPKPIGRENAGLRADQGKHHGSKRKRGIFLLVFYHGELQLHHNTWSSFNLLIDGIPVSAYDAWNGSSFALMDTANCGGLDSRRSVYLLPGEHSLTVQLAQSPGTTTPTARSSCISRGPTEIPPTLQGQPSTRSKTAPAINLHRKRE